jgi:hypothetical protein
MLFKEDFPDVAPYDHAMINHMRDEGNLLRALWRFLRPEADEIIVYIIIAFVFVGYASYRLANTGSLGPESKDLLQAARDVIGQTTAVVSSGSGWARFFLFGFWFMIGTLAYFIVWFVCNIFIDVRNNIAISVAFIHPQSFHQSDYWGSLVLKTVLRCMAAIALIFYGLYWLKIIAPLALRAIESTLISSSILGIIVNATLFLTITWFSLHLATLLVRIALLRYRFS